MKKDKKGGISARHRGNISLVAQEASAGLRECLKMLRSIHLFAANEVGLTFYGIN